MRMRFVLTIELVFLAVRSASAGDLSCVLETVRANLQGALFLHRLNPQLYKAPMVERTESILAQFGEKNPKDVQKMIAAWLAVIEKTHLEKKVQPEVLNRLKAYYYREHVISEQNFPDSYFNLQKKIAREQGHGDIEIGPRQREQLIKVAIEDQKESLDSWIEYLTSEDALYPMWAKVWAFNGMTRIEKIDAKTGHVLSRSSKTVAPFIDLNQEALSLSIEAVANKLHANQKGLKYKQIEENPELRELVRGGNFGKIYGFYVRELAKNTIDLNVTEGAWVKYPQGSDPKPLVQSLQCKNTGWCTSGASTAKKQLQEGGFYVYYSNDTLGRPKNPRIAIRMKGDVIAEVRGVGPDQEVDSKMAFTEVLGRKLKEFGSEGERYKKRNSDVKLLTLIEQKQEALEDLTETELRFLYEIDSKIEGFGNRIGQRVAEIRNKRNKRNDLAVIFQVKPEELALTRDEALFGGKKLYPYKLNLSDLKSVEGLKLPEVVRGDLILPHLESAEGLTLPKVVEGSLDLKGLTSAKGIQFPDEVHGPIILSQLKSAEGLKLPDVVRGDLFLTHLESAEGLMLPRVLDGGCDLSGLKSAEGLKFPDEVRGSIGLSGLTSAKGLKLPRVVDGLLDLSGLTSAKGLKLPDQVRGHLFLSNLKSAEGLKFPEVVRGHLFLSQLNSAEGLALPRVVDGLLDLRVLTSAKGLKFPDEVHGPIILSSLKSAEGLMLPKVVGGGLDLSGLKSAKSLKLPKVVEGDLYLDGLTSAKDLKFPDEVHGTINLSGLTSDQELILPIKFKNQVNLPVGMKARWTE